MPKRIGAHTCHFGSDRAVEPHQLHQHEGQALFAREHQQHALGTRQPNFVHQHLVSCIMRRLRGAIGEPLFEQRGEARLIRSAGLPTAERERHHVPHCNLVHPRGQGAALFELRQVGDDLHQDVLSGVFGIAALRPTALLGFELPKIVNGAVASLTLNLLTFVIVSLIRKPSRLARLQASSFAQRSDLPTPGSFRLWRASVTTGELEATVARYLGAARARESFDSFLASRGQSRERGAEADVHLLRFAERLLASATT